MSHMKDLKTTRISPMSKVSDWRQYKRRRVLMYATTSCLCSPLSLSEFRKQTFKSDPFLLFSLELWIHLREPMADRRQWDCACGQQQEFDGEARGLCCSCSRSGHRSGACSHAGIAFNLQVAQEKWRLVHSGPESTKYVLAQDQVGKITWHPHVLTSFLHAVRLSTSWKCCKIIKCIVCVMTVFKSITSGRTISFF